MVYEFAGAAGRSIEELKKLSLWEFSAVVSGYRKANTSPSEEDGDAPAPTDDEFYAAIERFG